MSFISRRPLAGAVVMLSALAGSSCALGVDLFDPGYGQSRSGQYEFDRGYERGIREGENDARRGNRYDFRDERDWQRAGSRAFREGFEQGYDAGYRGRGGYGYGQNDRYGRPGRSGGYGTPRGDVRYANPALEAGFNDGLEAGRNDARRGNRYDPVRSKDYRSADHGYDRRYGTREQWKIDYREGFRAGYDRGYRGR